MNRNARNRRLIEESLETAGTIGLDEEDLHYRRKHVWREVRDTEHYLRYLQRYHASIDDPTKRQNFEWRVRYAHQDLEETYGQLRALYLAAGNVNPDRLKLIRDRKAKTDRMLRASHINIPL